MNKLLAVAGAAALALFIAAQVDTPQEGVAAPVFVTPDYITWVEGPPSLPAGAKYAVLDGDPKAADVFTIRLRLPADYKLPPHFHPGVERVTVLSGRLNVASGDQFDPSKAKDLVTGSYMRMPPRTPHFAFTKEETIIQLSSMGPWDIIYVNPADDPRKK